MSVKEHNPVPTRYGVLSITNIKPALQQVNFDITQIYQDEYERTLFEERFRTFLDGGDLHAGLFHRHNDNIISYRTECILPTGQDSRPPLLLVFGNPASHSVAAGMFFSYEGNGREHAIWRVLSRAGIFHLPNCPPDLTERMQARKEALLNSLEYGSPFRIGLAVFYTMPSPPDIGVAGVKRLFGTRALKAVEDSETLRIGALIRDFVSPDGAVVTFQKDAYSGIKSDDSPAYVLAQAKAGGLAGTCRFAPGTSLFGLPPTRPYYQDLHIRLLGSIRQQLLESPS